MKPKNPFTSKLKYNHLSNDLLHELADAKRIKRETTHVFSPKGIYKHTTHKFIEYDGYELRVQHVVARSVNYYSQVN